VTICDQVFDTTVGHMTNGRIHTEVPAATGINRKDRPNDEDQRTEDRFERPARYRRFSGLQFPSGELFPGDSTEKDKDRIVARGDGRTRTVSRASQ